MIPHGALETYPTAPKNEWRWLIRGGNNRISATSEGYIRKAGALNSMRLILQWGDSLVEKPEIQR